MIRKTPLKIVAASGALVLGGAVAAAAVTTPDQADDGLSRATEKAGFEVPVGPAQEAPSDLPEEELEEVEELEEIEEEEVETEEEGERPLNHGYYVSEFAKNTELTGRERGQAIADVARSDQGKPEQAGGPPAHAGGPEGDEAGEGGEVEAEAGPPEGLPGAANENVPEGAGPGAGGGRP